MLKFNRTTEYALIALRHIHRKGHLSPVPVTSAREIADAYGLPFEILAKTLQRLKDARLIESAQGARGGYTLMRPLCEVTLADFLEIMEGPQSLVACCKLPTEEVAPAQNLSCGYEGKCEIQGVMRGLNLRVFKFLEGIKLSELTGSQGVAALLEGVRLPEAVEA